MKCADPNTWSATLKDCVCPQNFYVMEVEQGSGNFVKECSEECLPSAYPGPPGSTVTNCTPCPYEG